MPRNPRPSSRREVVRLVTGAGIAVAGLRPLSVLAQAPYGTQPGYPPQPYPAQPGYPPQPYPAQPGYTAQPYPPGPPPPSAAEATRYRVDEIVAAGHNVFGRASTEIASAIEYTYASRGEPTGYVVGQEAGAAFFGGLRYGEGELRMKSGSVTPLFWQGPSLGFDVGADGSRLLMLVYNLRHPQEVFDLFAGPSGLAYVAGGVGVSFHTGTQDLILAVIRTGVGLRVGVNVGYFRITPEPTWNPF